MGVRVTHIPRVDFSSTHFAAILGGGVEGRNRKPPPPA